MSGILKNYQHISTSYVPNNRKKFLVDNSVERKPMEEYNILGELIGYSWSYGNPVVLEFNTTGDVVYDDIGVVEDAEVYLSNNKKLKLELLNFRFETVYEQVQTASACAKFYIDKETSLTLPRSNYYCVLTLMDDQNNVDITLFDENCCKLVVK